MKMVLVYKDKTVTARWVDNQKPMLGGVSAKLDGTISTTVL